MAGASRRVLVMSSIIVATLSVLDASARTIRRACRDGASADRAGRLVACDVGAACDGSCAFELPICGTDSCRTEAVAVPAGSIRRERVAVSPGAAPSTLVLRCRSARRATGCVGVPIATITTTTAGSGTTGNPSAFGTTTTMRPRPVRASTSSTTSASTSSTVSVTTTTLVIPTGIPCFGDRDCDGLASACAIGFCGGDGFCAQACVCLTPELGPTCSVEQAKRCLTAGECVGAEDRNPACRVCYLNLCNVVLESDCLPDAPEQPPFTGDVGVTVDLGLGFGFGGGLATSP